jgi:hypothetical protein
MNAFAKAEGEPSVWFIANGWTGDAVTWLRKVNINSGQEADMSYSIRKEPQALDWHHGLLWAIITLTLCILLVWIRGTHENQTKMRSTV